MKKTLSWITGGGLLSLLLVSPVFAQTAQSLQGETLTILTLIGDAFKVILALIILVFAWGVFQLFFASQEEDKKKGRGYLIGAIIALAVLLSIWGLVGILQNTFNV